MAEVESLASSPGSRSDGSGCWGQRKEGECEESWALLAAWPHGPWNYHALGPSTSENPTHEPPTPPSGPSVSHSRSSWLISHEPWLIQVEAVWGMGNLDVA